jgi:tRNA U34 2-thiouridine synthase MnmA/TrmU
MICAVGLLSGGLDSTLAAKVLIDQGIKIYAVNFTSPFCTCTPKNAGCAAIITAIRQLGDVPLKRIALGGEYLDMVRSPRFGYGKGLNPCIDCRILKIRKAAEYMREIGASFLFTGEVLGQRPMSQHHRAIDIIDRESGIAGLILRPLSAHHFPITIPEQSGWVDRTKLLAISGRWRKPQIALAAEKGISEYRCPAGGCLLTDEKFAAKLRDYLAHTDSPSLGDLPLLKIGRHFRLENDDKIIVARNEREGNSLIGLARPEHHLFVPDSAGPVVLLLGDSIRPAIRKMLDYTKPEKRATISVTHRHAETENKVEIASFLDQ